MKILKFGGTSLESSERIRSIASLLSKRHKSGERFHVVVSACGKTTNTLLEISRTASEEGKTESKEWSSFLTYHRGLIEALFEGSTKLSALEFFENLQKDLQDTLKGVALLKEASPKTLSQVMSFGERLSSFIVANCLRTLGVESEAIDPKELIQTDESFLDAKVDQDTTNRRIREHLEKFEKVAVVGGFLARTPKGLTSTLGRGGSDYSAALIAAALNVEELEIWTDVSGVMTADPGHVRKAIPIPLLSYEELLELSHFGAQVIYPPTIRPLMIKGIPIQIRNTLSPDEKGTRIAKDASETGQAVTGMASIPQITVLQLKGSGMVGVSGTASRLFHVLAREEINVILISQASSEHSICVAVRSEDAASAKKVIEGEFYVEIHGGFIEPVEVLENHSIVAVVGKNMKHTPGIAGGIFQALGKNGINIVAIAQGSSEYNISFIVQGNEEAKALNVIHDAFFLSDLKTVHLYLVGVGTVGGVLLRQIQEEQESIEKTQSLALQVNALANSKKMVFDESGLSLDRWKEDLSASKTKLNLESFLQNAIDARQANTVFVDCTASEDLADLYPKILEYKINLVTASKYANARSMKSYEELRKKVRNSSTKFFYETNVGAGLPVIGTIGDLVRSGDQIHRIEAILSGTLSYIFNTFREGEKFSEIVKGAKEKGYTEPHPAEDLSGRDVARKLLILAREMGLPLEEKDIAVESLVPKELESEDSPEKFLKNLKNHDDAFEKRLKAAGENGEALRYIGVIDQGKARVALESVDSAHPFFNFQGSDNMIAFYTRRYSETPLVVRGPGAGAEVTAAGVLADILRAASYMVVH